MGHLTACELTGMANVRRTPSYQEAKEVSNAESNEWLGGGARRDDGQVNSQAVSRRAAPTNEQS